MPSPTKPRVRKPKPAPLTERHTVVLDGFEAPLRVADLSPTLKARIVAAGIPLHAEVARSWSDSAVASDPAGLPIPIFALNFSW